MNDAMTRLIETRDELASDIARRGVAWVGTTWFADRVAMLDAVGRQIVDLEDAEGVAAEVEGIVRPTGCVRV